MLSPLWWAGITTGQATLTKAAGQQGELDKGHVSCHCSLCHTWPQHRNHQHQLHSGPHAGMLAVPGTAWQRFLTPLAALGSKAPPACICRQGFCLPASGRQMIYVLRVDKLPSTFMVRSGYCTCSSRLAGPRVCGNMHMVVGSQRMQASHLHGPHLLIW